MKMIICDRCGHEQGFSPSIMKMKDGVERAYIMCEECKEQYTAYYTDKPIRDLQARQRRISKMIGKRRGDEYNKLYDEYKDNKQKLTIMMFELRKRMEQGHPPGLNLPEKK